jgi:hypothetical protein
MLGIHGVPDALDNVKRLEMGRNGLQHQRHAITTV